MDEQQPRKWYKKKRYIIPISFVGFFVALGIIGGATSPTTPAVQSQQESVTPSSATENVSLPNALNVVKEKQDTPTNTQAETTQTTQPKASTPAKQTAPTTNSGTYTNSAGNTVKSPSYSETKPADASAKCRDGSYSYSQSRQGTCSHHGGVAQWY